MAIFYQPKDGVCGDLIPFYHPQRKTYELYYLHDYRGADGHGEGTDWRRIVTDDMVSFTEEGEIIPRGTPEEQDLFCYTGCVVLHDGLQHIFYTGHNYHLMEQGKRKEAVMHAVSRDGKTWEKRKELTFFAPENQDIELNDWRDPYVFYNEADRCWWMLLCTRKKTGPDRLRGATGLLKSQDLDHWDYCGSFWNPSNCWCPECPELFRWGKWWYFIYSTFTEAEGFRTYYRYSETPDGPWIAPAYNTFDTRAFYAGKTASDGDRRFMFGWNPTRTGDTDFGVWQWGGCLVAHELIRLENGELRTACPEQIAALFDEGRGVAFQPFLQLFDGNAEEAVVAAPSGFAAAMGEDIPDNCMITVDILLEEGTQDAGLWLRSDANGDEGYYLRLEALHQTFAFDRVHRACDHNEMERHAEIRTNFWHRLTVLLDGTAMTAYLDDQIALSSRMYDYKNHRLLVFASDGMARFRDLRIHRLKKEG